MGRAAFTEALVELSIRRFAGGIAAVSSFGADSAVLLDMAVALAAYIYAQSISPNARSQFDHRPDEPDAVGEMLHGRHGPGATLR